MKILITGGLGFVGSNLAKKLLDEGNDITLLTRSKTKIGNILKFENNVKIIQKDIRNISKKDVKNMDCIYHCASTVDNYNIQKNPFLDTNVNVLGTNKLLEVCRQGNPKVKIVYVSTFFVQGFPEDLPVSVNQKPEPLGLYGASKLCAEHYCKTYNRVFDMNVKIARLSNVFGIGDQHLNNKKSAFNRMIFLATEGKDPIKLYDNGKIRRDFIYIDDVVDALITIMNKGKNSDVYYVGRGEGIKMRKLVNMILKSAPQGKVDVVEPPKFHNQVGMDDFWCDVYELKQLGWKPKVALQTGINKTVENYRKNI
jgi:nucleoside-diphosphate-sugar epimerase